MRNYELAVVLNPELSDDALTTLQGKVADWIAAAGGAVVRLDYWGRRRLAYPIGKKREGAYVFWYVQMPPDAPAVVERKLRIEEDVMRFLFVRHEEMPAAPVVAVAAEEPAGRAGAAEPVLDALKPGVDEPDAATA